MSKEIWMIGVHPPCPRCDLTRQRIARLINEAKSPITLTVLTYNDPEAQKFAASVGKEAGTAKHVIQKTGLVIDGNRLAAVRENPPTPPEDIDLIDGPARSWSLEFDEVLRPCQEKAESVGLLMTPIVVVDGIVKYHGAVPSIEQIKSWIV
jgi:hypothetical protein